MFEGLPSYPAYEDSGEPWMGQVPQGWELRRTKTVLIERSDKGHPDQPLLAATQTKGVVLKADYENRTVLALRDLHLLKLVREGDFVISLRSFQGGIEFARNRGIISPAYTVLYPKDPDTHAYLAWLFKSHPYLENLSLHVTGIRQGQNIDYERLGRSRLPMPPHEDRGHIVRFLDHVDRRIRRYIAAKKKLIALLNEQKQAIIHRAVTRGPDPNVPLKPSGVEWLGDVPEQWEIMRLKWVTRLQRGYDLPADQRTPGPFPVVSSGGLIDTHSVARAPAPGVVLGRYGSTDAVFFVETDFWPHNTALFVTSFQGNRPRWCYFMLRAISKADHAAKSAVPGVDRKDLFDIVLALPPVDEQDAIAQWLDFKEAEVATAINTAERQMSLAREYRTRLIADVVTGKVDVREAAAQLPDEVEERGLLDDADALAEADESDVEMDQDGAFEEVVA